MPNWASTSYAIEGPEEVLQKIKQAVLHPVVTEGSDETWEGNVLKTLGIEWVGRNQDREHGKYMRGFFNTGDGIIPNPPCARCTGIKKKPYPPRRGDKKIAGDDLLSHGRVPHYPRRWSV